MSLILESSFVLLPLSAGTEGADCSAERAGLRREVMEQKKGSLGLGLAEKEIPQGIRQRQTEGARRERKMVEPRGQAFFSVVTMLGKEG